jgi:hypothetical protein
MRVTADGDVDMFAVWIGTFIGPPSEVGLRRKYTPIGNNVGYTAILALPDAFRQGVCVQAFAGVMGEIESVDDPTSWIVVACSGCMGPIPDGTVAGLASIGVFRVNLLSEPFQSTR